MEKQEGDELNRDAPHPLKRPGPSRWTESRRKKKKKMKHGDRCKCQAPCASAMDDADFTIHESTDAVVMSYSGDKDSGDDGHSLGLESCTSEDVIIASEGSQKQSENDSPSTKKSPHNALDTLPLQEGALQVEENPSCCTRTNVLEVSNSPQFERPPLPHHSKMLMSKDPCIERVTSHDSFLRNGSPREENTEHSEHLLSFDMGGTPVSWDSENHVMERSVSASEAQDTSDTNSSEDEWEECKDMEMHFLDEEPELPEENPYAGGAMLQGAAIADDPDDPDAPGDSDTSSSESESDEDEEDNFSFSDAALDTPLQIAPDSTRRDALLLTLAVSIRHNWTYESLIDILKSSNTLFRGNPLPYSKKRLWGVVNKKGSGICKHAYCNSCQKYLGKKHQLPVQVHCECGVVTHNKDLKWFVSLSLKKQLEHFLGFPGIGALLRYRETRRKYNPEAVEDICDGERYQTLLNEGTISVEEFTLSYVFNTDGFRLFEAGNVSAWGLLVRLNELPPAVRQKHLFLAGLWVDKDEPNMNAFLRPFVQQANRLSTIGVAWKPDGVNEARSKVIPLCCCVDSKARFKLLNMTQYNGEFGCTYCTHRGVQMDGSRYPILPYEDLPPAELRTHNSIVDAMAAGVVVEGQKGPSELMLMDHFDLGPGGNAMDDLHPTYEGSCHSLTDLMLENIPAETLRVIDMRLSSIKTPSSIARKPSSVRRRNQWKGTEWRNWLLYYAVPCLEGLIPQNVLELIERFSYAIFLLSRDSNTQEDFAVAENNLNSFRRLHQERYGVYNMKYNLHLHSHAVPSVRNFGPYWTVSTFNFESWNYRMEKSVTSPKGIIDQIITRHLLNMHVNTAMHSDAVPEKVKNQISSVIGKYERKIARNVGDNVVVLGHASHRLPSPDEIQALQHHGLNCNGMLCEYDRVLLSSTEYRNRRYHEATRSDNSAIYTWDDSFGTINSIVVFTDQNGEDVCGFFLEEHEIENPFRFARHFAQLTGEYSLTFVRVQRVRCPAMKIPVRNVIYIVPMSNCYEID